MNRLVLIVIALTVMPMSAYAKEPATLSMVHFHPLVGAPGGEVVETTVLNLSLDPELAYTDSLARSNIWWCIVRILEDNVLPPEARPGHPFVAYVMGYHAGLPWEFWLRLARLGQAAERLGPIDVLHPEAARVLGEMKRAFIPCVQPMKLPGPAGDNR